MTMHSIIVQKRRKRSINFTEADRQVLMNLVRPHLSVIENKRMDKFTSKLKSETWENIKTQYNQLNSEPRTALQLKLFFEANKYRVRRMSKTIADNSSSDEKVDDKVVKVEIERRTIVDARAKNESDQVEECCSDIDSPKAKIKCVDIGKLQETKQQKKHSKNSENSHPASNSSPDLEDTSYPSANVSTPTSSNSALNIPSPSQLVATTTKSSDPSTNKQDELHAIRMKILEDERLFRQQEHLKHMEYFEIGIMALKTFLFKQAQSMPLITSQK